MKDFVAEFQSLSSFYAKLAEDIGQILDKSDLQDGQALTKSTLQSRELLNQIPSMNQRIASLTKDWVQHRSTLDPATCNAIDAAAGDAKSQASRLKELCSIHTRRLQAIHDEISRNLAELTKGARLAKVLKPVKQNYPKFIDSCC